MKKRLYMVQTNNRYGENVYLPFAVGCLWAYARTQPFIKELYELCDFFYLKEPIDQAVARLDRPDLVAISLYIWNYQWSRAFAKAVKEKWPNCTILVGGIQVQDESPQILIDNPQFDFAIYGEGEGAFADFLHEHATNEKVYSRVGSLIYRPKHVMSNSALTVSLFADGVDVKATPVVNKRRPFVPLEQLRSPYLDGVFDFMLDRESRWQVLQETCRGCPYSCSFCAWGQAALADLRPFPLERVMAELEWFGQHKVDYLDNADANFGVIKRDVEIARATAATKRKYGYPRTFRTSFAKNSNEVVWEIAGILAEVDMLKSVTLAMQSMEPSVLVNIRRKNIKFDKFEQLIERYEIAGIPTYTELILGLPGETLDKFIDGIEQNLVAGQHSGLFVYINLMLNNTEQSKAEYIEAHGLKSLPLYAMLSHATPDPSAIREIQPVIVETAAMSHEEWKRGWLYAKVIEVFHAQGLLRDIAVALHDERRISYRYFYMSLIEWLNTDGQKTVAAYEVGEMARLLEFVLAGGVWDCVDPRLGNISWPPEEFAFARICLELDAFYDEIEPFLRRVVGASYRQIEEQRQVIKPPAFGFTADWAREVVWYGRRGKGSQKIRGQR